MHAEVKWLSGSYSIQRLLYLKDQLVSLQGINCSIFIFKNKIEAFIKKLTIWKK